MEKIREVSVKVIAEAIKEMCIEANLVLSGDMREAMEKAEGSEGSELGKKILGQLRENLKIAGEERIPICQDTGMAVVFLEIGQDVHFVDGDLGKAIDEGVREGYEEGYLRRSVVEDPVIRKNTGDNTPAIVHTTIVAGDKVKITVAPKGFGSENMSRVFMLKPADGEEGVKNAVITAVKDAGANACPPMVVGVGVGGDFEKSAILAKQALTDKLNSVTVYTNKKDKEKEEHREFWERVQKELFASLNGLKIGPGGMGGDNTVLGVNIRTFPTHIAGMPVAVNICCHVNRHVTRMI